MRHLFLCVALLSAACASNTPTAPTAAAPQPGPGVSTVLRWDIKAPACQPESAPNPLPDPSSARMTTEPDGSITASYPYSVNGRPVMLYANFVAVNGAWAVCSWDTADI